MAMKRNFVVIVLGVAMFLCAEADAGRDRFKKLAINTLKKMSGGNGADEILCDKNPILDITNKEKLVVVRSLNGKATLTCKTGYHLVSSLTGDSVTNPVVSTCELVAGQVGVASWSPQAATCKLMESFCDDGTTTLNFTNGQLFSSYGKATLYCDTGYHLVSFDGKSATHHVSTCEPDINGGRWYPQTATCKPIEGFCDDRTTLTATNGQLFVERSTIGGTATLTCNEGSRRVSSNGDFVTGPEVFICELPDKQDGVARWSTQKTTCEPIEEFCDNGATLTATNGDFFVESRSIGGKATLTCNTGSHLVSQDGKSITNSHVSTCIAGHDDVGRWSTQTARCKLPPLQGLFKVAKLKVKAG
eukprot:320373_1